MVQRRRVICLDLVIETITARCRVPGGFESSRPASEYPHILVCEVVVEHLTILFDPLLSD